MMEHKNRVARLSRYRLCLLEFKTLGYVRVFSENLGRSAGVPATQVRKDFSLFGICGRKKGGYIIEDLLKRINQILGKDRVEKVILVGAGNLGSALLKYKGFEKEDIKIIAAFDADPAKQGKIGGIPIHPIGDIFQFVRRNGVRAAILAVPGAVAQEVSEMLVASGIRGILNFAPATIHVPEKVVVNNINLAIELENLLYYVNVSGKKER